jgi:hypothetical protein
VSFVPITFFGPVNICSSIVRAFIEISRVIAPTAWPGFASPVLNQILQSISYTLGDCKQFAMDHNRPGRLLVVALAWLLFTLFG